MEAHILLRQNRQLDENWWIAGRRRLFKSFLASGLNEFPKILEIGPGAGSNLVIWSDWSQKYLVVADADPLALDLSVPRGANCGVLLDATNLPFTDATFDVVLLGDVLEHLTDDQGAVLEIERILKPNGRALFTVPAFRFLWGEQDRLAGHQRRYRLSELVDLARGTGLAIERYGYFNWALFPLAVFFKLILKFFRPRTYADATSMPAIFNRIAALIFSLDVSIASRVRVPFGLSAFMLLRKAR